MSSWPSPSGRRAPPRPRRRRAPWIVGALVIATAAVGAGAAIVHWSGARLVPDPTALAQVQVQTFGGSLVQARASAPDGHRIPLVVHGNRLTPSSAVTPGETVTVRVTVRRPGWLGWALGAERHERLTIKAPVAVVTQRYLTVGKGSALQVRFDRPVSLVAYGSGSQLRREVSGRGGRTVALPRTTAAGSRLVAAAARPWERLGPPVTVFWFPPAPVPVALVTPAPGAKISPLTPVSITLSQPVSDVFGDERPQLSPALPGHWRVEDGHTLAFEPAGLGAPLASELRVSLPRTVALTSAGSAGVQQARTFAWTVAPASFLRLQQLLAQEGYLPLSWTPSGSAVPRTLLGQLTAAVSPPSGSFAWRYQNTPPELQALWTEGSPTQMTRGAVMMFEHDHSLAVDGIAGPQVWHALFADAVAGQQSDNGYSYVYVHRDLPQLLTLWHNGVVVLTSPGNTGVPQAPTQLGTFPVFEHIPVGTMRGTNPDGSHYNDPGIKWISYFNHGDALHAFPRASFGTPQSLGCVELPLDSAAKVWPYTPIGTLVTIEN
jgi:L,D-transpeptidase catalytic domain